MKHITVSAAIIHDEENRIFATQRGAGDWKDWWEFPGGKIEPSETPEEAVRREIWEELETRITVGELLHTIEWDYPKFHLTMHCFLCTIESGSLTLLEHEAARWLAPDELDSVQWLPADWEVIEILKKYFSTHNKFDNQTQKKNYMNSFEKKGVEFLTKINDLVCNEDLTTKDSLFEVLDHIQLKDGYHLGLKLADHKGMGDESWFYTYKDEDTLKKLNTADFETSEEKSNIFNDLIVKQTEMGVWQAYLLSVATTVLPLWWHANYISRTFFFDRDNFRIITPFHIESVPLKIQDIPQPSVIKEDNHFIIRCPYWNNWEGLVLVSLNVSFKENGNISFDNFDREMLYEFDCGICF